MRGQEIDMIDRGFCEDEINLPHEGSGDPQGGAYANQLHRSTFPMRGQELSISEYWRIRSHINLPHEGSGVHRMMRERVAARLINLPHEGSGA